MLKINKRQIEAFEKEKRSAYARELARYLRAEQGDAVQGLSEDELLRRVRIGIARAEGYGMTWDSSITAFVGIMFEIAPNFDEQAAIAAVLQDALVPPDTRVSALWKRTTEEDWEEAARGAEHAEAFWARAAAPHASRDAIMEQR